MSAHEIDTVERRGHVRYTAGIEVLRFDGWLRLSLDGRHVEARRVRGRNRWGLCRIEDVVAAEVAR